MTSCDLYLVLPADLTVDQATRTLSRLLKHSEITAIRVPLGLALEEAVSSHITTIARQHDVAVIVMIDDSYELEMLRVADIDGVHMSGITILKEARTVLGENIQIGCLCESRDQAMQAGEQGADYISFTSEQLDTVTWWAEVMELPTVVEHIVSAEAAQAALKARADFLAIPLTTRSEDTSAIDAVLQVIRH